ncbi:nitrogenase component I subunit alpha [Desulfocucumis palustris]|nr:nitrogenase component I subunit alpha [Desulfocucumis palustris]
MEKYPAKVFKNRKEHVLVVNKCEAPQMIMADARTIPGIITERGCTYAGCKGVVVGPLKDTVAITHGPIGCGYYSWLTRRNRARNNEGEGYNFLTYCFSTDMQEKDIIFGGENKLKQAIGEAVEIFKPRSIMICATCPVGLIGDDINAVANWAEKEFDTQVIAFSCEGYKGVSQSAGHHIANNGLFKHVIGTGDEPVGEYSVNILGEYNIGGDGWEIERLLKTVGYHIISIMSGDGSVERLRNAHKAHLNLVQCHRSTNYTAELLRAQYGTDWLKINFLGIESTVQSLRDIAKYFGDRKLIDRTEALIAEELAIIQPEMEKYRKLCQGKTAALFVGGSRANHFQGPFKELGMETVLAGFEFAHRDDYEGREVIPFIKENADNKNIENIVVGPDRERYRLVLSREKYEQLNKEMSLNYFKGMIKIMDDGSIVVDDINHYEIESFMKLLKPDVFGSGIKEKYVIHKMGTLSKQLHSYDYSGPFAGFRGAVIFARDVAMGLTTPAWRLIKPKWKTGPTLEGDFIREVV